MMNDLLTKLEETVAFIRSQTDFEPDFGIVLGTGLGGLAEDIEVVSELGYGAIPNFPISTVESHQGKLIFGLLEGKTVIAMQGRFHYYEGYSMAEVTFPIRVMKQLGIKHLFLSNAAGGLHPDMEKGDLMVISDHINLHPEHPLRGGNEDTLGPRFPDMLDTYDSAMVEQAMAIARQQGFRCFKGVYVSLQGPSLETPAEYKYLHIIGGDAVGMSTVPEVIVARHMDIPVFALSVITDVGYPPEAIEVTTVEMVIAVAKEAEPRMTALLKALISSC